MLSLEEAIAQFEWLKQHGALRHRRDAVVNILIVLKARLAQVSSLSPEAPALWAQIADWTYWLRGYQLYLEGQN